MAHDTIRFGIVGAGAISQGYGQAFRRCGEAEVVDYDPARFPGTMRGLERILVLPWNEKYTDDHVRFIADAVRSSVAKLAR